MRKKFFFFFLWLCAVAVCEAQSAPSQVISPQGGYAKNSNYSLEWTIGETVAATATTPGYMYTQGFNQSFLVRSVKPKATAGKALIAVTAVPNPVTSNLTVSVETGTMERYAVVLTNMFGVNVWESQTNEKSKTLSIGMSGFANGAYMLRVYDAKNAVLHTIAIIKL